MSIEVKSPDTWDLGTKTMFLAGSIEMGVAEQWQIVVADFVHQNASNYWSILNPRRDDWDSSWVQDISNENFYEQVRWELAGLEHSDLVLMYFDPSTQSPITLLELGMISQLDCFVIVCCPDGFWRKGNVQIMCDKYDMVLTDTKEEFFNMIKKVVSNEFVGHPK